MKPSKFASVVLAAALIAAPALAAEKSVAPLAPGKPAGVKEAAFNGPYAAFIYIGIFAAAAAIIATTAGSSSLDHPVSPSTTATGTGA